MRRFCRFVMALLAIVMVFVLVAMPGVALAADGIAAADSVEVTWGQLAPLGFVVLAVVDATKREYKDVAGKDLARLWVIGTSIIVGACAAVVYTYWSAFPLAVQIPLAGGALGLTVSGVIKFSDYGAEVLAKIKSSPEA